jgi:uncharacterized protein YfaS (alpha-2-macroglobulin family)
VSYYDEEYSSGSFDDDDDFWNRDDSYYPYGYNWEQRNNPCSRSYYNKERWATRNVIASNIGLTAKRGNNNTMLVAVTDILSTSPMADVELELLDYQQQVIYQTKSSSDGMVMFEMKHKPFLLLAKKERKEGT